MTDPRIKPLTDAIAEKIPAFFRPPRKELEEGTKKLLELADAVDTLRHWQPIETAPKDGTKVRIFSEIEEFDCIGAYVENLGWFSYGEGQFVPEPCGVCGNNWDETCIPCELKPTHWMPISPAPKEGKLCILKFQHI